MKQLRYSLYLAISIAVLSSFSLPSKGQNYCNNYWHLTSTGIASFQTTNAVHNVSTKTGISEYEDYSNLLIVANAGDSFNIHIEQPRPFVPNSEYYMHCWVDWNNDGDFSDVNENVFISQTKSHTHSFTIRIPGSFTGSSRLRVIGSFTKGVSYCPSYQAQGNMEDYSISVPNKNEVGFLSISNTDWCIGQQSISASLINYGVDTISSLSVGGNIEGVSLSNYNFSGTLLPGDTVQANLGSFSFNNHQWHKLQLILNTVNGVASSVSSNDTLEAERRIRLSGTYTVGGSNPDFVDIGAAIDTLNTNGVCGPVTFLLRQGTYNRGLYLNGFDGMSAANHVAFIDDTNDIGTLKLDFNRTQFFDRFKLSGVSHITIRGIEITSPLNYRTPFYIDNSHNVTINDCNIGFNGGSSNVTTLIDIANVDSLTFTENRLNSGLEQILIDNTGINTNGQITINSNTFRNGRHAIHLKGVNGLIARSNKFGSEFLLAESSKRLEVSRNVQDTLQHQSIGDFLDLINCIPQRADSIIVKNNFSSGSLRLGGTKNVIILHNTLGCESPLINGDSLTFKNNAFLWTHPSQINNFSIYRLVTNDISSIDFSHNFYGTQKLLLPFHVFDINGAALDLRALNKLHNIEKASILEPLLKDNTRPEMVKNKALNNSALFLPGISLDLDSVVRGAKRDIGCLEFVPDSLDAALVTLMENGACIDTSDIQVRVRNDGTADIDSIKFNWSLKVSTGNFQVQGSKTIMVTLKPDKDTLLTIDSTYFSPLIPRDIKVWLEEVNGAVNPNSLNDTLAKESILAGLSGIYTIRSTGGDFSSGKEASDSMRIRGVCGPTTILVSEDVGAISVYGIDEIQSRNFIHIKNDTGYFQVNNSDQIDIRTNNVRITGLEVPTISMNEVGNIEIDSNVVSTSIGKPKFHDAVRDLWIHDNIISGDITLGNPDSYRNATPTKFYYNVDGLKIENNIFHNANVSSIGVFGGINIEVKDNQFYHSDLTKSLNGDYGAIQIFTSSDVEISENQIELCFGRGISLVNISGGSDDTIKVFNNLVYNARGATSAREGISILESDGVHLAHNTVKINSNDELSSAIRIHDSKKHHLVNNLLVIDHEGIPIQLTGQHEISFSDYNAFYSKDSSFARIGQTTMSLPNWLASNATDSNSYFINPQFIGSPEVVNRSIDTDSAAKYLSYVKRDIHGEVRTLFPDAGASEFTVNNRNGALTYDYNMLSCLGNTSVTVNLKNLGYTDITYARIRWFIAEPGKQLIEQTPTVMNQLLTSGDERSIALGSTTTQVTSVHDYLIVLDSINGVDQDRSDDTLKIVNKMPPLSGTYYVGVGGDYITIYEASSQLSERGICGPIRLVLLNNLFSTGDIGKQYVFTDIPGVSKANSITITGWDTPDQDSISTEIFGEIVLKDVSHVTIEALRFKEDGFLSVPSGSHITVINNHFEDDATFGSLSHLSNHDYSLKHLDIRNNTGDHAFLSIRNTKHVKIVENEIDRSVGLAACDSVELIDNQITTLTLFDCGLGVVIAKNILGTGSAPTGWALSLQSSAAVQGVTGKTLLKNNFIYGKVKSEMDSALYHFNSIRGDFSLKGKGVEFSSNFYVHGSGYINLETFPSVMANNVYSTQKGNTIFRDRTISPSVSRTLADVQSFGFDSTSIDTPVQIFGTWNLRSNDPLLDSAGKAQLVTEDFDSEMRDPIFPDVGADEFTHSKNDLSIEQIEFLSSCSGNEVVELTVQNQGADTIKEFSISLWAARGSNAYVLSKKINQSFNLSTGQDSTIKIPGLLFGGISSIKFMATVDSVNKKLDDFNGNDTILSLQQFKEMSGEYFVGGLQSDFSTLSSALKELKSRGNCDTVVFSIRPGVYRDTVNIVNFSHLTVSEPVFIQPDSAFSGKVAFEIPQPVEIRGLKTLFIRGLIFESKTGGAVLQVTGGKSNYLSYLDIDQCSFIGLKNLNDTTKESTVVSVGHVGPTFNQGVSLLGFRMQNCEVYGGSIGISLANYTGMSRVANTTVTGFSLIGIENNNSSAMVDEAVLYNHVSHKSSVAHKVVGIVSLYDNPIGNSIHIESKKAIGIELPIEGMIVNSEISVKGDSAIGVIGHGNKGDIYVFNSSIYVSSSVDTGYGLLITDKSSAPSLIILNSAIKVTGGIVLKSEKYFSLQNSCVQSSFDILAYREFGNVYMRSISDMASYGYLTTNSFEAPMHFSSDKFLYPLTSILDSSGRSIQEATHDILGRQRDPQKPDIGAYEYDILSNDAELIAFQPYFATLPSSQKQMEVQARVVNIGRNRIGKVTLELLEGPSSMQYNLGPFEMLQDSVVSVMYTLPGNRVGQRILDAKVLLTPSDNDTSNNSGTNRFIAGDTLLSHFDGLQDTVFSLDSGKQSFGNVFKLYAADAISGVQLNLSSVQAGDSAKAYLREFSSSGVGRIIDSSRTRVFSTTGDISASLYYNCNHYVTPGEYFVEVQTWSNSHLEVPMHFDDFKRPISFTKDTNDVWVNTDSNSLGGLFDLDMILNVNTISISNIQQSFCEGDSSVQFFGNPIGGQLFGTHLQPGNTFVPDSNSLGKSIVYYTLHRSNGCQDTVEYELEVNPLTELKVSEKIACSNQNVLFLTGSLPFGGTYSGKYVNGGDFSIDSAGIGRYKYYYDYQNSNGCTSKDSNYIKVVAPTVLKVNHYDHYCSGQDSALLDMVKPDGGVYYGTYVINNSTLDLTRMPIGTQSISYHYTDSNNCNSDTSIVVDYRASPTFDLGKDREICGNQSVTLDSRRSTGDHLWSTGDTTQTIIASSQGLYWLAIKDNGCTYTDSIKVSHTANCLNVSDVSDNSRVVELYPNPSSGKIWIKTNTESNIGELILFSAAGAKVNMPFHKVERGNFYANLSTLEKGVYFLEVNTEAESYRFRLVLQ